MIEIFGKLRYHWQPELSMSIIFWSITFTPLFISLSMLYERVKVNDILPFLVFFAVMLIIGLHRYFEILPDKTKLRIHGFYGRGRTTNIAEISKISVFKNGIILTTRLWPQGKIFYMRHWPKKYFVDALVVSESFKGQVELNGHVDHYFELYKVDKKSRLSQI
jgi:hypothetical protein